MGVLGRLSRHFAGKAVLIVTDAVIVTSYAKTTVARCHVSPRANGVKRTTVHVHVCRWHMETTSGILIYIYIYPVMIEFIPVPCWCMSFLMCYCSITHYLFGFIYGTIDTIWL